MNSEKHPVFPTEFRRNVLTFPACRVHKNVKNFVDMMMFFQEDFEEFKSSLESTNKAELKIRDIDYMFWSTIIRLIDIFYIVHCYGIEESIEQDFDKNDDKKKLRQLQQQLALFYNDLGVVNYWLHRYFIKTMEGQDSGFLNKFKKKFEFQSLCIIKLSEKVRYRILEILSLNLSSD